LLDRLPVAEAAALRAEIAGERALQPALHVRQMHEYEVFEAVADAVHTEVGLARAALETWRSEPPTALLLELCDLLETQVVGLKDHG
jgi:hypothetical protein